MMGLTPDGRMAGTGFGMVAVAAALWGTDALFRHGLAHDMPAVSVVMWEHVLLAGVLAIPLWGARGWLRNFGAADWLSVALIGAGASTGATIAFTVALSSGHPTTTLLLQKIQPLIALVGARILLGERPDARLYLLAVPAFVGVYLVTFPSPAQLSLEVALPAALALLAASLWGLGTVLGRRLSSRLPFVALTGLRFVAGLPVAVVLAATVGTGPTAPSQGQLLPLVGLAFVPGLAALLLYYRGLQTTPASLATIAELAFPLTAALVSWLAFDAPLTPTQWLGVTVLSLSVATLGHQSSQKPGVYVRFRHRRDVVATMGTVVSTSEPSSGSP